MKATSTLGSVSKIAAEITALQTRRGQIIQRQSALRTELSKLHEEDDRLSKKHMTLLREFDTKSALPTA